MLSQAVSSYLCEWAFLAAHRVIIRIINVDQVDNLFISVHLARPPMSVILCLSRLDKILACRVVNILDTASAQAFFLSIGEGFLQSCRPVGSYT